MSLALSAESSGDPACEERYAQLIAVLGDMGYDKERVSVAIKNTGVSTEISDFNVDQLCQYIAEQLTTDFSSDENLSLPPNHSHAIQIFRPKKVGSGYELDYDALERIFSQNEVAESPVAIYSLAGAYREGKSFMLNLFLIFLRSGRSDAWLDNKQQELDQGFCWKGGQEKCTEGIWIWSEPFKVATDEGEVIIFLMDTQGTLDNSSSLEESSLIFALSTLISSVQIFNIMRQIDESNLHYLQLFTEYGILAKKENQNQVGKTFQKLVFLIRDWHDPDYQGWEGGRLVLENKLKVQKDHKDLTSVRENIRESFESVECMLLPKPGDKIETRSKNSPPSSIKDVKEEFLDEVKNLVDHLFRDHITMKRINGNPVTGSNLINFIIAYCKVFESGKMPKIEPIMKATAKAAMLTVIQKCKHEYIEDIKQKIEGCYKEEFQLKELHQKLKAKALSRYDELPKMGEKDFIKSQRKILADLIDQHFPTLQQINIVLMEQIKDEIRKTLDRAETIYSENMQEICRESYVCNNNLEIHHQTNKKLATDKFLATTNHHPPDLIARYKLRLEDLVERAHSRFVEENKSKEVELHREISRLALRAEEIYTETMDKKCNAKDLLEVGLEAVHDNAIKVALTEFDSLPCSKDVDFHKEKRNELENLIHQLKMKYKNKNQYGSKAKDVEMSTEMMKAKTIYNKSMDEACKSSSDIDHAYEEIKKHIDDMIEWIKLEKGEQFACECRLQLDNYIQDDLYKRKRKNLLLKANVLQRLQDVANFSLERYKNFIRENHNEYIPEPKFTSDHEKYKTEAINFYKISHPKESRDAFEEVLEELKTNLSIQHSMAEKRNEDNKQRALEEGEKVLQEAKGAYVTQMEKFCHGRDVEDAVVKTYHEQCVRDARDIIQTRIKNTEVTKDFLIKFDEESKELLRKTSDKISKNSKSWLRQISYLAVDAFITGGRAYFTNFTHSERWKIVALSLVDDVANYIKTTGDYPSKKALTMSNASSSLFTNNNHESASSTIGSPPSYEESVNRCSVTPAPSRSSTSHGNTSSLAGSKASSGQSSSNYHKKPKTPSSKPNRTHQKKHRTSKQTSQNKK